jgi:2-oxoglutarate ferredoxin oxidoreductase subunit alpha
LPIVAAATPGQCFDAAIEAVRIAVTYRTPVILLSDTYLANSSEPWQLPEAASIPEIDPEFATGPNRDGEFLPYLRNERGARPWAPPGVKDIQHVIGGLEKQDETGTVSYDADNHARMIGLRAQKVAGIAEDIPELEVDHEEGADLLVLGWGSSFGAIKGAVRRVRLGGGKVARAHLYHLNPFPKNTGEVLRTYDRVLVPEMNTGQLSKLLRAEYLVDVQSYTKVDGQPIIAEQLDLEINKHL